MFNIIWFSILNEDPILQVRQKLPKNKEHLPNSGSVKKKQQFARAVAGYTYST